jgi:predicted HTH domain antitoxin
MEITVHLPDDFTKQPDPGRTALESLAVEGYKTGALSHYQASQLLGLTRIEFDAFLKDRRVYDRAYGVDELNEDRETVRRLRADGLLKA